MCPYRTILMILLSIVREAAKKSSFLSGGGGLNGCATKDKRTFFYKVPMATKLRGDGLKT